MSWDGDQRLDLYYESTWHELKKRSKNLKLFHYLNAHLVSIIHKLTISTSILFRSLHGIHNLDRITLRLDSLWLQISTEF
jgi:hypothetical protein